MKKQHLCTGDADKPSLRTKSTKIQCSERVQERTFKLTTVCTKTSLNTHCHHAIEDLKTESLRGHFVIRAENI